MAVDQNFKITKNDINKNFDQLKRSSEIWSSEKKQKKSFDQTPNLTENFDQLKMSSEIWSSDHSPSKLQTSQWFHEKYKFLGIRPFHLAAMLSGNKLYANLPTLICL